MQYLTKWCTACFFRHSLAAPRVQGKGLASKICWQPPALCSSECENSVNSSICNCSCCSDCQPSQIPPPLGAQSTCCTQDWTREELYAVRVQPQECCEEYGPSDREADRVPLSSAIPKWNLKKNIFPTSRPLYMFVGFLWLNLFCYQKCFKEKKTIIHSAFLVQGEPSSMSNQPSCHDLVSSSSHSYTEPIIAFQRLQQLSSIFFLLCRAFKSILKCICRNWVLRMLKNNELFFFPHTCTCMRTYYIWIYICHSRFYFPSPLLRLKRKKNPFFFWRKNNLKYLFVHSNLVKGMELCAGRKKRVHLQFATREAGKEPCSKKRAPERCCRWMGSASSFPNSTVRQHHPKSKPLLCIKMA